jgi:putative phage-type endonuclease
MTAQAARLIRLAQGSDAWLRFRQSHLGASDAPVALGESPYATPLELWAEKRGLVPLTPSDDTLRLWQLGKAIEPVALRLYADATGRRLRRGGVYESRTLPWLSASLDALTADGRVVEAKFSGSSRWAAGVPDDVVLQVQHQLAVLDRDVADVVLVTPHGWHIHEVRRDPALWAAMLPLLQEFWEHVVTGTPPSPIGRGSERAIVAKLHPDDNGQTIEADPVLDAIGLDYVAKRRQLLALEAEVAALDAALRLAIGEASEVIGSGWRATYRRARSSVRTDWEALARAALEHVPPEVGLDPATFTVTSPGTRRLIVKEVSDD